MMYSKLLGDALYKLNREALSQEAYAAATVYSTAEDLADGMLKGLSLGEALPHLLGTYAANAEAAPSPEEKDAWLKASSVARELAPS